MCVRLAGKALLLSLTVNELRIELITCWMMVGQSVYPLGSIDFFCLRVCEFPGYRRTPILQAKVLLFVLRAELFWAKGTSDP